jgi:acyl carrier protein
MSAEPIRQTIRDFICRELFDGDLPGDFTDDTALVSSRLMDSISTLYMVNQFEEKFNITFEAHEVTVDNLDSISILVNFITAKMSAK